MIKRLPPLKSLEAFVRAARHLSFGQAAAEMGLSASAVSRRIRFLEEELDVLLFHRRSKSVELTAAGQDYFDAVAPAFAMIANATADMAARSERITVTAPQSFAVNWLTPRLRDLRAAHPEIEVDLEVSSDITGRHADRYDIGIFLSRGPWPDREVQLLSPIATFPVCSPEMLESLHNPADLADRPLLHVRQLPNAWGEWLAAVGAQAVEQMPARRHDMFFNDVQLAYEAARRGLGVAMGADIVVEAYLRDGSLVAPFPQSVRSGYSYHLVATRTRFRQPAVRKLFAWLRQHANLPDTVA